MIEQYIASLCLAEQERIRYLRDDLRLCAPGGEKCRFLDLGAGSGTMSIGVLLLVPSSEGTLVDIQDRLDLPDSVSTAVAGRYRSIPWKDVAEIADATFDLVLSTDVLEHIPDWRDAFQNLCRYVHAGGYLYVQAPSNYRSPSFPTARVWKHRLLGYLNRNDPNQHVRHGLSCKQLFDEASKAGLQTLLAAEDYVVDSKVFCDFKPRCHCLFRRQAG